MKRPDFNDHVDRVVERTKRVLQKKNQEYGAESEVFHNFKEGVAFSRHKTDAGVAWEYMGKHLQSIKDLVGEYDEGDFERITPELIDEKFGDAINYLILIEGMFREKIDKAFPRV